MGVGVKVYWRTLVATKGHSKNSGWVSWLGLGLGLELGLGLGLVLGGRVRVRVRVRTQGVSPPSALAPSRDGGRRGTGRGVVGSE